MPNPPLILLSFANDGKSYLEHLNEEERTIRRELESPESTGRIVCESIGAVTLDDIYRNFNRNHNRICIFHYGGHSDADFLQLHDQKARAANLSVLMGMQENLRLVFLNGCANAAQVQQLLSVGVKVVIATVAKVDDLKARGFAEQFYNALSGGKNLQQAFDTAISFLQDKFDVTDGMVLRFIDHEDYIDFQTYPWQIHAQQVVDLEWRLPEPQPLPNEEEADYTGPVKLSKPVNQVLVEGMAKAVAKNHEEVSAIYKEYKKLDNVDEAEGKFVRLKNILCEIFPLILAKKIRPVFSPLAEEEGHLRLKLLLETYLSLIKFLTAVSLSDLWKASLDGNLNPKKDFVIREVYKQDIRKFMSLEETEMATFDYVWLVATANRILKENGATPYLEELANLSEVISKEPKYYQAYRFLEQGLRLPINQGRVSGPEVESLCHHAEHCLTLLLEKCAFLSNYQLVSVSNISVYKTRRVKDPEFHHQKVMLRGIGDILEDKPIKLGHFTDHRSVFITLNIREDKAPLNLSPFLIDINAYRLIDKKPEPKVSFLSGMDRETGKLRYLHAETLKDFFWVPASGSNGNYLNLEVLQSQYQSFKEDLKL